MIVAFFSSLRARLILLVLLAVVPALGLIIYTGAEMRRTASMEAQASALQLARSFSSSQDELIQGSREILTALAQMPMVRGGDTAECNAVFANLLKQYSRYHNFFATKPNGDVFCSAIPSILQSNLASVPHFQAAVRTGNFVIGDYAIARSTGRAVLGFAYPVLDATGEIKAVLFAGLDLEWLNALVAKTELPEGATFTVSGRKGTVLARFPNPEKWVGKSLPEASLIQTMLSQGQGTAEASGMDGIRHLYGFSALGDTGGAYVSISIPKDVAFASANRLVTRNLVALGIVSVFAIVAAWFGSSLFVLRQVSALTMATRRLSDGELGARTELPYGDGELSELARAFDQMAGALQSRQTEAKQMQEELQRHLQQSTALREINLAVTSTLDLHAVLRVLMERIDVLLPYTALLVWLRNRETGEIERAGCWNLDEAEWKGRKLKATPALVQTAIDGKRPVVVSNIQTDPRVLDPDFYRRHGLISYLGVPLVVKGEVLGVLVFLTREGHEFTADEIEFLSTLAGQAAIAIHNSQLYEKTKRQAVALESANEDLKKKEEIQELLKELNQDVTRLDIDSLLKKLTEKVRKVFKVDASDVRILKGDEWSVVGVSGIDPSLIPSIRRGSLNRRSRWIIDNRKPLAVPDTSRSESHPSGEIMRRLGLRGYLGIPLISRGGEVVGVLRALTYQPRNFFQEEVDLLQQIANGAAIALENARLLEQTKSQATHNAKLLEQVSRKTEQLEEVNHQLSALCSVATVVSQSLDMNLTLHNGMHQVLEIFGLDAARIYIFDQDKKELHLAAHEGIQDNALPRGSYQPGEGFIGRVFETGEAVFFKDIQSDPEFQEYARKKIMLKAGFRAQFFIPIRIKGKTLGVISFAGKSAREFSPSEKELLYSIADHIGIAVENATLFSELRAKTNELEKADKVKNEFLGFVSHELKTPVNTIVGYIDMMHSKLFGEVNADQEKALEKVMASSKELLNMINSLLEATKIEAGAVSMESQEVNLYGFFDELRSNYCVSLEKKLDLIWDYPSDLPMVETDNEKLRHVLQNLINNAIKYTDEGSVTISARHFPNMSSVEFRVTDTGIGIPEEALPFIFEKFHQVNGSENRSCGGVGLGLHIVKRFTELLGGKIEVETEEGRGSTFTVRIPCTIHPASMSRVRDEERQVSDGRDLAHPLPGAQASDPEGFESR